MPSSTSWSSPLDIDPPLELFDRISSCTPVIANLRPTGQYQMEIALCRRNSSRA